MKIGNCSRHHRGGASARGSLSTFVWILVLAAIWVPGEAEAYSIPNSVFSNGGEKARNGVHIVNGTIGQPLVGISSTHTYKVASGVWHDTCGILWTGTMDQPGQSSRLPARYSLSQNYPNPFNPTSTIEFSIPERTHVTLNLYNILGEVVAELLDEDVSPGEYRVTVNAHKLPSGVYFYRLAARDFVKTRKMVLLK